jgi:hypothetical protein
VTKESKKISLDLKNPGSRVSDRLNLWKNQTNKLDHCSFNKSSHSFPHNSSFPNMELAYTNFTEEGCASITVSMDKIRRSGMKVPSTPKKRLFVDLKNVIEKSEICKA